MNAEAVGIWTGINRIDKRRRMTERVARRADEGSVALNVSKGSKVNTKRNRKSGKGNTGIAREDS